MDGWPGQALLIAMVLLILGVGLCLFDGDEGDDGMCVDLCRGLAMFSVAAVVLVIGPIHLLPIDLPAIAYATSLRRLDPPPKRSFLS
jgi:hypothetical protein